MSTSNRKRTSNSSRRGGALLAVLWLAAALSAIAFAVASTVRVETDRASTLADSVRAQYLAVGAVESALIRVQSAHRNGRPPVSRHQYRFASGEAVAEVIPEASRLSLSEGRPADLVRLLMTLGADPQRAQEITAGIVAARGAGGALPISQTSGPSFPAAKASFQEVEELIWVPGMTPELFHGSYLREPRTGQLVRLGALKDCVSVYGAKDRFDAGGADPALLASLGIPWDSVARIVAEREASPLNTPADLGRIGPYIGAAAGRLTVGGNSMFTIRATARVRRPDGRLSEVSRSVSALVKYRKPEDFPAYQVLRWNEHDFSPAYSDAGATAWRR
jgi:hypothetical protein